MIRALSILDAFAVEKSNSTLSVKNLHELLDLPKPTVSRLATILEQQGFLRGTGNGYQLGPRTFELGAIFGQQYGVDRVGRPPLEAMARETLQTSSLAILSGPSVVYLIVERPAQPVHHVTQAGSREYAHVTGLGKALLAALPPQVVDRILGASPFPRLTKNTLTERDLLHEELELTRRRGYALDQEEFALGLRCVAIQIELPRLGSVAISVSGPAAEYSPVSISNFLKTLHETADALEAAFTQAADYL